MNDILMAKAAISTAELEFYAENPNTNNETFEYLLEQGRDDVLWYVAGSTTAPECYRIRAAEKLAGDDIEDAFFRGKITYAMKELVLKNQRSNIA